MKNIRSILHILLGVTLICSCNEATELAHITPNVSLIKYKDIVKKTLYIQLQYLQPIITQYFIDNKSEIWLLFLIAHSKR